MPESTAVATVDPNFIPPNVSQDDWDKLTPEERSDFAALYMEELAESREGVDIQMPRLKMSKDSLAFVDDLGNVIKELRGTIIFKHTARGLWHRKHKREDKRPNCQSLDGKFGQLVKDEDDPEGNKLSKELGISDGQNCATCPFNQFGSAFDDAGNPRKGKMCKEMRRIYLAQQNAAIPALLTLPPSSIRNSDDYFSARLNRGIADIAQEAVLTVRQEKGEFDYAVAEFELGDPVPPKKMLRFKEMRGDVKRFAQDVEVDAGESGADDEAFG